MNAPLRSATRISSLPQQCLLPQERFLNFLTAAAVLAPAGSLSLHPLSFTHPPPPLFPHCRSSACSSRSPPPLPPSIFSLPQQCLLQQEPLPPPPLPTAPTPPWESPPQLFLHYRSSACSSRNLLSIFPTTAVVPAPTGFFSICPHCPSSDRSRRSAIYFPTTAVVAAPAGALSLFPTAPAVPAPAGAFPSFPHCPSSACSSRSATCISSLPQ